MGEFAEIREKKMRKMIEDSGKAKTSNDGSVVIATDQNFDLLTRKAGLCLVDFWAEWCGPCRMMSPIIEELAKEYAGKIHFYKLNVDDNPTTAQRFEIMSIPTLLIMKNGTIVDTIIGAGPKKALQEKLARQL